MSPDPALLTDAHRAHLARLAALPAVWERDGLRLGGQYVMFHAEARLMRRHAELLLEGIEDADLLEVGGGLGVFAREALPLRPRSYTAIEPHPRVARVLAALVAGEARGTRTRVVTAPWQMVAGRLGRYHAIMYDTWPPEGMADRDFALFVERVCARRLRPGGRFSFFASGEPSPARLEILRARFARVHLEPFELMDLPPSWTKPTTRCTVCVAVRG
ncbi:MAG TPA: class I SAM-dependent methyltransferase [Kofleriaceae bacterium]|nr:class I SAM-dependent methyltransferase [Kofleriaceae bacterium]